MSTVWDKTAKQDDGSGGVMYIQYGTPRTCIETFPSSPARRPSVAERRVMCEFTLHAVLDFKPSPQILKYCVTFTINKWYSGLFEFSHKRIKLILSLLYFFCTCMCVICRCFIMLAAAIGKSNVTVWRPSVCLLVFF